MSEHSDQDELGSLQYPPDRPLGAEDRGVTDAEDSVAERRRRENPDRWAPRGADGVGPLVDAGEDGVDAERDAVATEARRRPDPLGVDRSVQDLEEVEAAEEAAMHLTDDPPYATGDDDAAGTGPVAGPA